MTYLEQYYDLIKNGENIVGYYMHREIENLIEDLSNPAYIYVTDEANKRIKFMETCCLQGKEPYYGKPMILMPFQKAFIEALYSFKMADTGLRRFQEALLLIARKNGKTQLMAADGLYDLFCGSGGQDICVASNDDKQASIMFSEIAGMMQRLDKQGQITSKNLVELRNDIKNIKVTRMSSKVQNKDGRNYSKVYFDEGHECDEPNGQCEVAEACWRGMSTKDEPLFINCSTEGFCRDAYLDRKIQTAKDTITGEIDNIHFLPFLFIQDSEQEIYQNEDSWQKANPALKYGIKKTAKLRMDMETAKRDSGSRIHMLTKDFNLPQNTAKAWLGLEDYTYEQEKWTLEDFRGAFCIAAADLSMTTDLTNVKLMFIKPNTNKKYIWSHYWIPELKLQKSPDKNAGASYTEWIKSNHVSVCDGTDNNLVEVAQWILDLKRQYGIKALCVYYDQRFAKEFCNTLEDFGVTTCVIQQSKYTLSSPIKLLEAELKNRLIEYNSNPVDMWCYSNASLDMDNAGRVLIVKQQNQPEKRIDGAVTAAILYAGYQRCRSDLEKLL